MTPETANPKTQETRNTNAVRLTPRQLCFLRLVASGKTETEAYLVAYASRRHGGGKETATRNASRLMQRPGMRDELTRLNEQANRAAFDLRAVCQQFAPRAVAELERVAKSSDRRVVGPKVQAIKEILDRGFGQSPQRIELQEVRLLLDD